MYRTETGGGKLAHSPDSGRQMWIKACPRVKWMTYGALKPIHRSIASMDSSSQVQYKARHALVKQLLKCSPLLIRAL